MKARVSDGPGRLTNSRRVGLLGGSFDPVHKAHVRLAEAALRQLRLDVVYLMLTPQSPFKTRKMTPVARRLRWLRLALKGKSRLKVGTWEVKSRGPYYTAKTLERYRRKFPNDKVFFIVGSDAWNTFPAWKGPQKILHLATLVVGKRPGAALVRVPNKWKRYVEVLNGTFPGISSTEIRQRLSTGKSLSAVLHEDVLRDLKARPVY